MIAEFTLMMLSLTVAVPIYWAIPAQYAGLRLMIPIILSVLLLTLLSPLLLLSVVIYLGIIVLFRAVAKSGRLSTQNLKQISWAVFAPLIFIPYIPTDLLALIFLGAEALSLPAIQAFAFLGISYTAIRTFIIIREDLDGRKLSLAETGCALVFFGSFSAGPITGGGPYRSVATQLTTLDLFTALARIGFGVALFSIVNPYVDGIDLSKHTFGNDRLLAFLEMYRRFFVLYIDFTGYTEIAIGSGLLFGIRLPENFRWPLVATSIQEFWQRWHLSLGAFIGTYLFKPLVRQTGKPALGIFVAFVLVGLWHSVSLPYLIWGFAHGAALAITMILRKRGAFKTKTQAGGYALRFAGWVFTISFVAFMSGFANQDSLGASIEFALNLVK